MLLCPLVDEAASGYERRPSAAFPTAHTYDAQALLSSSQAKVANLDLP